MRPRWSALIAVAALSFFLGGWLVGRGVSNGSLRGARLFDDVMSRVTDAYVDSLPAGELYDRAADGLLRSLNDPYTVLMRGSDYTDLTENISGKFSGIGIQIDVRDGWITVVAPLPDTPAERAGLRTGDRVVEVDGTTTEGWNSDQALHHLRGTAGTKVKVGVRHPGQATMVTYELTRAEIHVRSVTPGVVLEGGVGYLGLNPVADSSAYELEQAIDSLLQSFADEAAQRWPNLPVVILVNEGTASAAEIIAGALQDHDRALLLGAPTYGKGLVQSVYELGDSTALKITTSRWYTPSGRLIQKPHAVDSILSDTSRVAADTTTHRTDAGRRVRGGGGIQPDLVVEDGTLGAGARALAVALGSHFGDFRDVTTALALEAREKRLVTREDFVVTEEMRRTIRARLAARGVRVQDGVWIGGRPLVDQWLESDLARYVFGREAELRRRRAADPQLQAALALVRRATTPKALLGLLPADTTAGR